MQKFLMFFLLQSFSLLFSLSLFGAEVQLNLKFECQESLNVKSEAEMKPIREALDTNSQILNGQRIDHLLSGNYSLGRFKSPVFVHGPGKIYNSVTVARLAQELNSRDKPFVILGSKTFHSRDLPASSENVFFSEPGKFPWSTNISEIATLFNSGNSLAFAYDSLFVKAFFQNFVKLVPKSATIIFDAPLISESLHLIRKPNPTDSENSESSAVDAISLNHGFLEAQVQLAQDLAYRDVMVVSTLENEALGNIKGVEGLAQLLNRNAEFISNVRPKFNPGE